MRLSLRPSGAGKQPTPAVSEQNWGHGSHGSHGSHRGEVLKVRESPFCLQILSRGDPNTFKTPHREQDPLKLSPWATIPQTAKLCQWVWAPLAKLWSLPTKSSHTSSSKSLFLRVQIPRSYPPPDEPINNPTAGPGLLPWPRMSFPLPGHTCSRPGLCVCPRPTVAGRLPGSLWRMASTSSERDPTSGLGPPHVSDLAPTPPVLGSSP